ncbi:MAG: OsmC family protein [Erysipelotrichaceae bacterium]|nr:OsmC family protein [Erysipelotrichaceae bacterium]
MSKVNAELIFENDFNGHIIKGDERFVVGEKGLAPYDMLQGALVGCFHATFLSIIAKKRLSIVSAHYYVDGIKKEDVPTTLSKVHIKIMIKSSSSKEQLLRSFELAAKYCSIYNTITMVAKIDYEVIFED